MNDSLLTRIWIFYRDGFREMTLGRTARQKLGWIPKPSEKYSVPFTR